MNKAELANAIAKETKLSKTDSKNVIEAIASVTTKSLKKGEKVSLIGFGSWSVSKRSARTGRNPQTGASIKIAAKKVVRFKPGTGLSESVK